MPKYANILSTTVTKQAGRIPQPLLSPFHLHVEPHNHAGLQFPPVLLLRHDAAASGDTSLHVRVHLLKKEQTKDIGDRQAAGLCV